MKRWMNGLPGATKRLGAMMAQRGLSASQPRMRADTHDGPEQMLHVRGLIHCCSSHVRRSWSFCLATHGPGHTYILAHRVISPRCGIWSLSGHRGHGRTCCWLDPIAKDPKRASRPYGTIICENHAMPKARWLMEPTMPLKKEFSDLRLSFEPLTFYQKFEQVCVLMLTTLIAIIIALALWNLTLKILLSIWATNFDPTDYGVFQTVFGMIFTVIIALEFKRSLLVVAERRDSVVQVRSVILIALLAVVRKLIILDLSSTDALHLLALAAAILALGAVYWLVRDQGQPREIIAAGNG